MPELDQTAAGASMDIRAIRALLKRYQSVLVLALMLVIASFACVKNGKNLFLSTTNIMNVLRAISENGIIAVGMTMVILLGGIDLSVGSVLGLVGTGSAALMMHNHLGLFPTVLLSLGIGAAYGVFNGIVITKMRMQPFLVTLASMNIARGLARIWSNGAGIPLSYGEGLAPPAFEVLQARVIRGMVPVPAILFVAIALIFWLVLSKTRFGRQLYATGGNKRAAYLSGVKVERVTVIVFVICSVLSALAGMVHAAQVYQGGPNDGIGYELNAVAAVCIGGTSLAGGVGTIGGTIIGALILGLIDNVMGLNGINSNIQLIVKGLILILAVFMQADRSKD